MWRIVVDTSVLTAALLSENGASRAVLRLCLRRQCQALIGEKLFHEYEDLLGRPLLDRSPLGSPDRREVLTGFLAVCEWTEVSFLWRPNLPDEGDNHLVELAIAGMAGSLVTHNLRDFRRGELRFPTLQVETPGQFLKRWRIEHGDDDHPTT